MYHWFSNSKSPTEASSDTVTVTLVSSLTLIRAVMPVP